MSLSATTGRCFLLLGALALGGCVGRGEGAVRGVVSMPLCELTRDDYDLGVDFYGASWFNRTLNIRLERSGSIAEFTDSMMVSVDDTDAVANALAASAQRDLDGTTVVTLPVAPEGTPGVLVHATFTPTVSCGRSRASRLGDNLALRAQRGWITFRRIYHPRTDTSSLSTPLPTEDVTEVTGFYFEMGDSRQVGPTMQGGDFTQGSGTAQLSGYFRFTFSRGVPAQSFFP